jgi:flagellar biosynthetic protein FliR
MFSWTMAFLRAVGICFSAPVLSTNLVPLQIKIALAVVLSSLGYSLAGTGSGVIQGFLDTRSLADVVFAGAGEVALGLLMGYGASLALVAPYIAGHFIDIELGLGMVQVLEPGSSRPIPLAGNLLHFLALVIMLETNQHHLVISGFMESLRRFPPGGELSPVSWFGRSISGGMPVILEMFSGAFASGIKMGLPVAGCLFLATALLGVLSRAVPQMNVFMVGIPVKALLGFLVLGLVIPAYAVFLSDLVEGIPHAIWLVMRTWG